MKQSLTKTERNFAPIKMRPLVFAAAVALAISPMSASATSAQDAQTADSPADPAYSIERSATFTLQAKDGHGYRMMVAWPYGVPPATGWPVIYVLDGDDNFAIVTQTLRRLARSSARSGVHDHVIVAIDSGSLERRILDYTPPTPGWTIPAGVAAAGHPIGGGEAFLDFLSQSAMPNIAARWSVNPNRQSLLGHSFGGLIGLHAALSRPDMFQAVAAISPSFWFGDGLLHRESAKLTQALATRTFIAAGDKEGAPGGGAVDNDYDGAAFAGKVGGKYQILVGQSHGSTMLVGLTPALKFLSERDVR